MILLVLALIFGFACPLELTFELQEHDVMCFHEVLEVGARIILDYQVISGGQFDIDCHMTSPSTDNLYKGERQQADVFRYTTTEQGEFSFCFSNEFSSFAHKTVYFDFASHSDSGAPPGVGEEGAHATALTQLESTAFEIHTHLRDISDLQTKHKLKETIGRELAEILCARVQDWSVGQTIVIMIVGFGQVVLLKKLFDKKPPIVGKVGI